MRYGSDFRLFLAVGGPTGALVGESCPLGLYARPMGKNTTRLHIFRHGQVADPWPGMIYGCLDVPLSEEGHRQALWAARSLQGVELGAVISSGLQRAEASAAHLRAERDLDRRDEKRLVEIDRGSWAGLTPEQVNERQPGGFQAWTTSAGLLAPPGGETIQVMAERVGPKLLELAEEHAGSTIAIVAHMWVVRIALCMGLGRPWQDTAQLRVGTGARTDFEWTAADGLRFLGADAPEGSGVEIDAG